MKLPLSKNLRKLAIVFAAAATLTGCQQRHEEPVARNGDECVQTADTAQFQQQFPELYNSFKKIGDLPYSGRTVAAHLQNPANRIMTCRKTELSAEGAGAFLADTRTLEMRRDKFDPMIYTHEIFHAEQEIGGALLPLDAQTTALEDNVQGNMLVEAAAVGYSFIVYKEMSHTDPAAYKNFTDSWYSFNMRPFFDAAYARALPQGEERALEAGGKAVVSALLNNANKVWAERYIDHVTENNRHQTLTAERAQPDYISARRETFRRAGAVSATINITPDWLLAAKPEKAITAHLARAGYTVPNR